MRRASVLAAALAVLSCGAPPPAPPAHVHGTLEEALRPTEPGALWRYDPGEVLEAYDSPGGGFVVHFTREGRNAVPTRDADGDGVPDLVQAVAEVYDDVARVYQDVMGFRAPLSDEGYAGDDGGDARFDVYLVDFALSSDGSFQADGCATTGPEVCYGHIVQENDFAGYGYPNATVATRILGSHEYFHAIQDAYDADQGAVLAEGTAVWASEAYDPDLPDLEGFAAYYLATPDRSLDVPPPGPAPAFAYGTGLFFEFLSERFEPALIRRLWEHVENGRGLSGEGADPADPVWTTQLDLLLAADHGTDFASAFVEFARWNLYTGSAADPELAYRSGAQLPMPAMTEVEPPYEDDRLRVFHASTQYYSVDPIGRYELTAALVDDPATPEDETADLSLVLATLVDGRWRTVDTVTDLAAVPVVDVRGARRLVVGVVNGALSDPSRRPGLCLGDPDEVDACVASLSAVPEVDGGTPDGGSADGGVPGGGGGGGSGCGCTAGAGAPGLAGLLVLASGLLRRRRVS